MDLPDGYYGVIQETPPETDFQLTGGGFNVPTARNKYNGIQYQQTDIQTNSCTLHGAIGAISDLFNYTFTLDERKEIYQLALQQGFNPSVGWYVSSAVNLLRNWWNKKYPDKIIMSFNISFFSQEATMAKKKGYSLVCSFDGDGAYNKDESDGILDGVTFGSPTYGHCLRMISNDAAYDEIVDNYVNSGHNTYRIPIAHEGELIVNHVFSSNCYIFVIKADFDTMNATSTIPLWGQASWNKVISKGLAAGDPNRLLAVQDIETLFKTVGIFSQIQGNISYIRLLVALDRLGKL